MLTLIKSYNISISDEEFQKKVNMLWTKTPDECYSILKDITEVEPVDMTKYLYYKSIKTFEGKVSSSIAVETIIKDSNEPVQFNLILFFECNSSRVKQAKCVGYSYSNVELDKDSTSHTSYCVSFYNI